MYNHRQIDFYERKGIYELGMVKNIISSGRLSHGPWIGIFEEELAEYIGAPYVIATNSCTSALYLALKYYKPNKVSIPSMTFGSVASAVLENGIKLEFDDRYCVGHAYKLEGSDITDSAHEIYRDCYRPGTMCFSFYSTKNLSGADGGAIATDDKDFYDWAQAAVNCGRDKIGYGYDICFPSLKYNMTNLQAGILSDRLRNLDKELEIINLIVSSYNTHLDIYNTSNHLYTIKVYDRDSFMSYMKDNGIETSVHFKPLHQMTAFNKIKVHNKSKIDKKYEEIVSLPLHSNLSFSDVDYICDKVKKWRK